MSQLGDKIKRLIKLQKMKRKELAEKTKLSEGTVYNATKSPEKLRDSTLESIAKALNMTLEELFADVEVEGSIRFLPYKERILANIHILCYINNIKRKQIADELAVREETIARAMNGETRMDLVERIANVIGYTLKELSNITLCTDFTTGYKNVKENIELYCYERGMLLGELAKELGVSRQSFCTRNRHFSYEKLLRISEVLGVPLESLLINRSTNKKANIWISIQFICIMQGITINELSETSGVCIDTIKNIGKHEGNTSRRILYKIAKALDKELNVLESFEVSEEDIKQQDQIIMQNIKRFCKEQGLSIQQLAIKGRLSYSKLLDAINGKRKLSIKVIRKIASTLGVTYEQIVNTP